MRITAFANYADPQTLPMYRTLYEKSDGNLILAATEPLDPELQKKGYPDYNETTPFVKKLYEEPDMIKTAKKLADESDVLIYGHCPAEFFNLAVKSGKPVFRLSQHIYRDGNLSAIPLKMKTSYYVKHTLALKNKPVYLMCVDAYTAQDFSLTGSYKDKMFEFGAFTEVKNYDAEELMRKKEGSPVKIVWANHFRSWYHPETVIELARGMQDLPCIFELYGTGTSAEDIKRAAEELSNVAVFTDDSLETVHAALETASVFLLTSDYRDGWSNILNRAMNRACACVVSTAAGASKMLGRNENGLLYEYGNIDDLGKKVRMLVSDPALRDVYSRAAFAANRDIWNGVNAGERLYGLFEAVLSGKPSPYREGLCAPAEITAQSVMTARAKEPVRNL